MYVPSFILHYYSERTVTSRVDVTKGAAAGVASRASLRNVRNLSLPLNLKIIPSSWQHRYYIHFYTYVAYIYLNMIFQKMKFSFSFSIVLVS